MNKHLLRCGLAILACAVLAACQDRRDPVKPIADTALAAPASAAAGA